MQGSGSSLRTSRRVSGITYAVRDVVALARQAADQGREMIYLNIGDPCQFDFRTPQHVIEAIVRALRDGATGYAPSEGTPEAIDAITRDAVERKQIKTVRHVLVGNGASEPIEILLTALLDEGDEVLVPEPGYPLYTAILAKLGGLGVPYELVEENGWQPDPDALAALVTSRTRAIVLIHPNNPTGAIVETATQDALLEIAARHGLVVLSDEIYDRMLLDDETLVATASRRDDVLVATFGGLSKVWLGPGLRIGWSILSGPADPAAALDAAMMRIARARLCASHPVQSAIAPALFGPLDHVARVNATLRRRRDVIVSGIGAIEGWSMVPPRAAFYAFPRFDLDVSDVDLVKTLILETGVVTVHGSGFGQREGTRHIRIVFLPKEETLRTACSRLAEVSARYAPGA